MPLVAGAAPYPERPISLIVAYAPGGGTDLVARNVAQNKPGAGGGIGFAEVARASADGYTIGFLNTPNLLTIPIERSKTFTWESFDLLGNLIDDPGAFTVHADHSMKNLKNLSVFAKANRGKVTAGTTGIGSDDHLAMMLFEKAFGTTLTHVP